ncbi:MAG TPA: hypothetical protein VEQ58_01750 [Polyangiaceae bacterium]|nr:hypothetical protein [Polyangiaceae bacterium]
MPSALRSAAVFAFVSAVAALAMPGCSQQGEGERCDSAKNADADCDNGLTCIGKGDLLEHVTDRCCPAAGTESDKRCVRGSTMGSSGSGGSSSSDAGTGGQPSDENPPTNEAGTGVGGAG